MLPGPLDGQDYIPVAGSTTTPLFCNGVFETLVVTPPPSGGAVASPVQLAQQAVSTAPFKPLGVVMSPPPDREAVNFPIFLSLNSGFSAVTATASAGGVTSTVTIVPESVTWSMGDGGTVTCDGPGVPYNPALPFASQLPPPCGYTYQLSSANQPGEAFQVTATVHYIATWVVSGAAGGGNLGPIDRSITLPVTVGEIQVLNQ